MAKQQDPKAEAYGKRLEDVRIALGCRSRAALARYLSGPNDQDELQRIGDRIRKYEDGEASVPPDFTVFLGERAQEPGIMDYIYKDIDGRLTEDFRNKVRAARSEREAKQP